MVIKKDAKTGKYFIAPSPKEFYESPSSTKKSTGVGSGSGVYYDIDDPNKTPVVRDGGGFTPVTEPIVVVGGGNVNRGGGSSNKTQAETIAQINRIAQIQRSEEFIQKVDAGNKAITTLGIGTSTPTSSKINPIIARAKAKAESDMVSLNWSPTSREIADAGFKGRVSPENTITAQKKILTDQIKRQAEEDIAKYSKKIGEENTRAYEEVYKMEEDRLKVKFNDIQNRINNGGDYKKLVAEWENYQTSVDKRLVSTANDLNTQATAKLKGYSSEWVNTTGRNMESNAGLVMRSTERLVRLSPKQLSNKFTGAFVGGAVVGGGATAIVKATGLTLSKTAGATLTGVGAGVSLGLGFATAGYDVAKGKLDRKEYLVEAGTRGVEGGVSFLGGFSGAVAGSVAVTTASNLISTGNVRGIKPLEQRLAKDSYDRNGLAMRKVSGEMSEGAVRKASLGRKGEEVLIKEIKVGNVVRKATFTPNLKDLSVEEIKALNKFRINVDVYSVYDRSGNIIKTIEVAKVTGKAPITKIIGGADETLSFGELSLKNGVAKGDRISFQYKGLGFKDRLTISGQQNRLQEIGLEKVKSVGSASTGDLFRLEVGKGTSTSVARIGRDGIIDFSPRSSSGSQLIVSEKIGSGKFSLWGGGTKLESEGIFFRDRLGLGVSSFGSKPISLGSIKPPSLSGGGSLFSGGSTTSSSGGGGLQQLSLLGGATKTSTATSFILSPATTQAGSNIISATPLARSTTILAPPSLFSKSSTSTISLMKTETKNTNFLSPKRSSSQIFSPAPTISQPSAFNTRPKTRQIFAPIQTQQPAQSQIFKLAPAKQIANKTAVTPISSSFFGRLSPLNPTFSRLGGGGLPPLFLGRVDAGGGGMLERRERGGISGRPRYNASLGSVLIGYEKKGSPKSLSKKTFSGLGLRPQLFFTPQKKKTKKKK